MAKNNVTMMTEKLRSTSRDLMKEIQDQRKRAQDQLISLRELEDVVKNRQKKDQDVKAVGESIPEAAEPQTAMPVEEPVKPAQNERPEAVPQEEIVMAEKETREEAMPVEAKPAEAPQQMSAPVQQSSPVPQSAPKPIEKKEQAVQQQDTPQKVAPAQPRPVQPKPQARPAVREAAPAEPEKPAEDKPRRKPGDIVTPQPLPPMPPRRPVNTSGWQRPMAPRDGNAQRSYTSPQGQGTYAPRDPQRPYTPRDPQRPYTPRDGQRPYTPRDPQRPYTPRDPQRPYTPRDKDDTHPAGAAGQNRFQRPAPKPTTTSEGFSRATTSTQRSKDLQKKNSVKRASPDDSRAAKSARTRREDEGNLRYLDDDYEGSRRRGKKGMKQPKIEKKIIETAVITTERVNIKDLAEKIGRPAKDILKECLVLGVMVTSINQDIEFEIASMIADDFGVLLEQQVAQTQEERMFANYKKESDEGEEDRIARPPVVTIMGHVDHGKTSILDAIRKTKVTETEAGGITQRIGAYQVEAKGRKITFLDTPGHEAFTTMRKRGAQATDIAVLVIAANDGVMPQTIEAINHAKAANVPIIVAINKMDLPGANPQRIRQQLTEYELVDEQWGGDTVMVEVSATTGAGLDKLLETILLVADIAELKADPGSSAKGIIIEAKLDKNRGPIATVLVQNGTLHIGDNIVVGTTFGRVRAMYDDVGANCELAGPSTPVELLGLEDTPEAGEMLYAVENDKIARQVAEERQDKQRAESNVATSGGPISLDDFFKRAQEGETKDLNIVIKADVRGSVEAVKQSLEKLSNNDIKVKTVHSGVGAVTENDIMLASASQAVIIAFNIQPTAAVSAIAEREGIEIRTYRIIYNAIEDMEKALKGMLEPEFKENVLGHAEVRSVFKITGVGAVAGCYVTDGKVTRSCSVRVLRDSVVLYEGKLSSLKRFKDDVREVASGYECGMSVDGYNDIKEGDVLQAYVVEEVERV